MNENLPLRLGIAGYKESGKTTLIEHLLAELTRRNLRVAVIKHQQEMFEIDAAGTDTDRLYKAGAKSILGYDGQTVFIRARQEEAISAEQAIGMLCGDYDLILVEGFKESGLDKLWLLREGEEQVPESISNVLEVLPWSDDRCVRAMETIRRLLRDRYGRDLA